MENCDADLVVKLNKTSRR